ncbi:LysE family translocator [Terrarubrum flagellatum]|uniref:LysE family translocator n=1 Tax=Terrirubrum flagellatum TaxID=2895980 RepID=UPI003144DD04
MTLAAFLAYALAHFLAAVTPGPSMFAVISTGVSRSARLGLMVGVGVGLGDALLVTLALLGLAALATVFGWAFAIVKYAGAAYLIWLGIKMWRAAPQAAAQTEASAGGGRASFMLGAAIALGNPKAILFHASLMPLILDMHALTLVDSLIIIATVFTINLVVMGFYAHLAGGASRWLRSPSRLRIVNRVAGAAMIGTGAAIAAR